METKISKRGKLPVEAIPKGTTRRNLRETLDIAHAEQYGCKLQTINFEIDPVNLM